MSAKLLDLKDSAATKAKRAHEQRFAALRICELVNHLQTLVIRNEYPVSTLLGRLQMDAEMLKEWGEAVFRKQEETK